MRPSNPHLITIINIKMHELKMRLPKFEFWVKIRVPILAAIFNFSQIRLLNITATTVCEPIDPHYALKN